jgi:glycosyltransferase involved in cell wall biosynthesis
LTPDINQLKKMMREAFNNPEQVQRKGIQGVETAKQFTWENSAKQLINLS